MDIKREDDGRSGAIKFFDKETEVGKITFTWSRPERILVDHTEVYLPFRERGIGHQLVAAIVDFAREKDIQILPLCPFTRKVMEEDPASHDVLFLSGSR